MEVKVSVEGIQRVVCGVTEETTCQEVVVALAQALSQPGRYVLREKFKDFERCMAPNERLLETLEKYGEQAREVQLTLVHNGPCVWNELSRAKVGRYQPNPPLRRKDAGARMRRGSGLLSLHRQSLPPMPCSRQEAESPKEDLKKPKRKSLTLMEEAWEWLESLRKGKVYSTGCDKDSKKTDKRNHSSLDVSPTADTDSSSQRSRSKFRGQRSIKSDLDNQTSCCMGSQTRGKEIKRSKKSKDAKPAEDLLWSNDITDKDEKNSLKETIIRQLSCLQDLQVQIDHTDKQIFELEERQRVKRAVEEAQQRLAEEEMEQIKLWENELKAEEGHGKDLEERFLEMKTKVAECKANLEEYKCKMQGLDFFATQNVKEDSPMVSRAAGGAAPEFSSKSAYQQRSDPEGDVYVNRKFLPREDLNSPRASPNQTKERRPTGPTELREWWTRWSEAQNPQSQTKKVVHRSELTIYLGGTKI